MRPSETVCAIVDEVLDFQMPGIGIPGFRRKAAEMAKAGIYDIRGHRDEVLLPLLTYWKVFELEGLNPAAEEARRKLADHLETLDQAAKRAAERRNQGAWRRASNPSLAPLRHQHRPGDRHRLRQSTRSSVMRVPPWMWWQSCR